MDNSLVLLPRPSYTYADIGLVPRECSEIESRKSHELNTREELFDNILLDLPVLLAPMESVVGPRMATIARQQGGLAILPRNETREQDVAAVKVTSKAMSEYNTLKGIAASIPATKDYLDRLIAMYDEGVRVFCVDLANGYSRVVARALEHINALSIRKDLFIITGNVASVEGYHFLAGLGVDAIRVGIGGGSVCTTSIATGIGVGQASLVREMAQQVGPLVIADGGIKNPGDVVKAIALGADYVMSGGMFAGCDECPGDVIVHNGQQYKLFSGQASKKVKGTEEFVEGASVLVPAKGTMKKTWKAIEEGLRSGMSYLNKKSIKELRYLPDSNFVILSDAAKAERGVHAIRS